VGWSLLKGRPAPIKSGKHPINFDKNVAIKKTPAAVLLDVLIARLLDLDVLHLRPLGRLIAREAPSTSLFFKGSAPKGPSLGHRGAGIAITSDNIFSKFIRLQIMTGFVLAWGRRGLSEEARDIGGSRSSSEPAGLLWGANG
jgi:hypothetical protein